MSEIIYEMLSYPFLVRALIVGSLVSLCAALLGVSLVLKRYSMIGDGLSHVGFGAMAVACVLGFSPLAVSLPVVICAAFLLLHLSENSKIKGDSAIALISSGAMALGVLFVSLKKGVNTNLYDYMFGSILSLSDADAKLSIVFSTVVIIFYILFYHKIFVITFDSEFAKATGIKVEQYNTLLAVLTAVTVALGMRMMGTLLISSLIIFPPLTAMRLTKRFSSTVICSAVISLFSFFTGMIISYCFETPTGASIVAVNCFVFFVFLCYGRLRYFFKK